MLSLRGPYRVQHSTPQSAPHKKQQTEYVPIRVNIKGSMYVRTCTRHPGCFPGAWSPWPLNIAWLDHLLHMSFRPILLCEQAERAKPPATRSALFRYIYISDGGPPQPRCHINHCVAQFCLAMLHPGHGSVRRVICRTGFEKCSWNGRRTIYRGYGRDIGRNVSIPRIFPMPCGTPCNTPNTRSRGESHSSARVLTLSSPPDQ